MSDLDKAIRDHLARVVDETMERRNGLTSILPGTDMARVLDAIRAALGALHEAETFNPGMTSAVELVRARLAYALGVSGDRSEPTPAPALRPGDTVRLWVENDTPIVGRYYLDAEDDDRERVESDRGGHYLVEVNGLRRPIEVVSPEGTS